MFRSRMSTDFASQSNVSHYDDRGRPGGALAPAAYDANKQFGHMADQQALTLEQQAQQHANEIENIKKRKRKK